MDILAPNSDDLIECYLDVCNQALALSKDRFPFKQILGAAKKSESACVVEVNIVDALPPVSYVMKFNQGKIVAAPHLFCADCNCDRTWNITKGYLEGVVNNAQTYIDNPAKINWEWLDDRPV